MRVVASLTTMPYSYKKLYHTLVSLNNQTRKLDAIYLTLPKFTKRMNEEYPPLPDKIKELCTVVDCDDYGPITKLFGGLIKEKDDDTCIITFDDDCIYPPKLVEFLLSKSKKNPHAAIGTSGLLIGKGFPWWGIVYNENYHFYRMISAKVPKKGREIDSLYGYAGVLYKRSFFPSIDELIHYSSINKELFMNDDIVISGYLSLKNIPRIVFSNAPEVRFVTEEGVHVRSEFELSNDPKNFVNRLKNSITSAEELGMFSKKAPMKIHDCMHNNCTVASIAFVVIIFVIALIMFGYLII